MKGKKIKITAKCIMCKEEYVLSDEEFEKAQDFGCATFKHCYGMMVITKISGPTKLKV